MLKRFSTSCSLPVESLLKTTPVINVSLPDDGKLPFLPIRDVGFRGGTEHLINGLSTTNIRVSRRKYGLINESTALITITITLISIYLFSCDVSSVKTVSV
jgi:hypothetical protein